MKPLSIDLYCGLGGWSDGLLSEGYRVVGFDIERHVYGSQRYPAQLVLQDVTTLHGSQFKDAALIVASPPCQRYSYMSMPWSEAKREAAWQRWERDSPFGDKLAGLNGLFDACFRLQREASEAAGHLIPMVVENVRGAEPWVGPARWHFGSYYLWGDVPGLMPFTAQRKNGGAGSWFGVQSGGREGEMGNPVSVPGGNSGLKGPGGDWFKDGRQGQDACAEGLKTRGHANMRDGFDHTRHLTNQRESKGVKQRGSGAAWFDKALDERRKAAGVKGTQQGGGTVYREGQPGAYWSGSTARKAASAQIAKIPFELARWIAHVYKP